jgi:hypothetical protein
MVFSNFTRTESGNQIFFKNSTPIEYVEKLKYYKDDSSGTFTKKEFRWSFNNSYWSNWEDLNQGNVSDTEIKNNRYLFIEVRYTKSNPSANVTHFEINYSSLTTSSTTSSSDKTITSTTDSQSTYEAPSTLYSNIFSNFIRSESGNQIFFRNYASIKYATKIKYYKDDSSGTFTKKEFRWSFNNSYWSNWEDLNQGNLSDTEIRGNANLFIEVRYTKSNPSANVTHFEINYSSLTASSCETGTSSTTTDSSTSSTKIVQTYIQTPVSKPYIIDVTNAQQLCGKGCDYYLWRPNHKGQQSISTIVDLQQILDNLSSAIQTVDIEGASNVDGPGIGVYYNKIHKTIYFKKLVEGNKISISDDGIGHVTIDMDDASINNLYEKLGDLTGLNVGSGPGEIFAGKELNGDFRFRTLSGSGAIEISQSGDDIIIGIDASFGGEVNYGENIGDGDASIYYQKLGDSLQFRTLKGTGGTTLDVSNGIIEIGSAAPIDGGVWITDISPGGSGNVGDKTYSSDGNVLDSCLTDTTNLIVSVLALPGHTNYKPVVTINSNPVSLTESSDKPLWTGTYNMTYNFADASITAVHENGARWSTIVDADSPATILSADFTGGYPGTQTELKVGDTYAVRVQTDVAISSVIVDDYGAATGGTYSPPSPTNDFTFIITIADRGNTTVARGLRLRVVKPTGSTSANYLTENQGSVDGKDLVNLNNTYPEISFTSIDYPVGQQAIKSSESAIVNHTVTDYNTINYTSPGGQLNITNSTIYEPAKNVDYSSGGYNINTDNFSISANRAANNAASSYSTVVWIANTPATLSVSHASKMRSGGNDGTSVQNHQIAINSDQRLLSAPDLIKDTGGTWAGTGFSWSPTATTFTRNLAVHDDESKTTYNWGSITGTNLAGIVTSTNSGTTQYVFSGFVVRTITVQPLLAGKANTINVEVTDYTKLSSSGSGQTLTWTVKDLTIRSGLGDTADGQAETWSASGTGSNPTTIYILDTNALNSSSQASTFTIQEGV